VEVEGALRRVYEVSLRLYPAAFRGEFGAEMKGVFAEALADAHEDGWASALLLTWRELRHLPGSWLREHWQAWSQKDAGMNGSAKDLTNGEATTGRTIHGWGEALLAALPYLLIGILEVVISLLTETGGLSLQSEQVVRLNYALLIFLVGTLLPTLVVAWWRQWPLWSASWYLFYALPLFWLLVWLVPRALDPFSALGQIAGFLLGMVLIAGLLYRISRLDRLRGILAALPILYFLWLPNLEQTPNHIIPLPIMIFVEASSAVIVALAIIAMVRLRDWRIGFWIALAAFLAVGLQYSYVGIYYGGALPNVAPGPSPVEVVKSFLPQYFAAFSILVGPLFARLFRGIGRSSGAAGKVGYHLALLALLAIITASLVGLGIRVGDFFGDPGPTFIVLEWVISLGLAGYAVSLGVLYLSARRSGALPDAIGLVLLAILPMAMPLTMMSPFNFATQPVTQLYGFPVVRALPGAVVLGAGLTWLLLSAWLVTRRQGTPTLPAAILSWAGR
jgi:hypothetical protein